MCNCDPALRTLVWYINRHTLISRKRDGKPRMIGGQFVVVCVGVHQLSVSPNTSHPMLQICSKLLHGNSMPSLNYYKKFYKGGDRRGFSLTGFFAVLSQQQSKEKIEFQHSNEKNNSEHSAENGNDTHEQRHTANKVGPL